MKMKRKLISGVLALSMAITMAGCGGNQAGTSAGNTPQETDTATRVSLQMDLQEYPKMDGSTANLPLMAEVLHEVCNLSREEAEELVSCSKTSQAWWNLVNGDVDILLVYEPDEGTRQQLAEQGVELEVTPIGRDGLVFINNEKNPVKNLTTEQLQGIYTGAITNWSQVGGEDVAIEAFQRRETSGSQAMFRKLVMQGLTPMDAPVEWRPTEMGELIDVLAEYNDSASAIGYSVYYYVSQMYAKPGLRLMDVDGVSPTKDTIATGEYPFTNEFFVAIRAAEPADSPARQLYNWICSEEGTQALITAGYVPIQ